MRILVVEDEYLVAMAVESALITLGFEVLGPFPTIEQTLAGLNAGPAPDGAILDLNLRGRSSMPIAEVLRARDIPFVFATGYEVEPSVCSRFPSASWLRKPYGLEQIQETLIPKISQT